jgi:hypothetical protein
LEFLAWLESLPPIEALKTSFIAYPLVNALHILAIGALVTTVILMDLRILGFWSFIDRADFVRLMRRVALTSFAVAVLAGLPMFAIQAQQYVTNPAFVTKMALILVAGLNFLAMQRLAAAGHADARSERFGAKVSAVTSILLWLGALVAGRLIGFV